jgi:hypothetical protein
LLKTGGTKANSSIERGYISLIPRCRGSKKSLKLTIVISGTGINFGLLKKVGQANKHITFSSGSVAATATMSSIIITTSTTR